MTEIASELNTIMAGEEPLKNLKTVQTGINEYKVLSARNGSATVHHVNLDEPSCTCEDMQYNKEKDSEEVCAHIAKAALVADSTFDAETLSFQAMLNTLAQANEATENVRELEELLGRLDEANRSGQPEPQADASSSQNTDMSPLAQLKDAVQAAGVPPDDLEFVEHNDMILFGPDGYLEDSDVYGNFIDFSQEHDEIQYRPDDQGPDNGIYKSKVGDL